MFVPSAAPQNAAPPLRPQRSVPPPLPQRSAGLSFEARRALGALTSLIDQPKLRDVLLRVHEGVGEVWVDDGGRLQRLTQWHLDAAMIRGLAVALIAAGGRQLDELHPCVDVHLGGGVRVHAVLPPASVHGPLVSIRLPSPAPPSFDDLVAEGLCDDPVAAELRDAVRERKNLLIVGRTGSGKTTLLAALLALAPAHERILTIEDLAELRLDHPHHVALEARPANSEGMGALSVDQLLREALRMRPDRIVLGECRGAEIATLLTALNTGHEGGAGTLHANRLEDVPVRLEALGMMAGLSAATLARQAASALHLIVHLDRARNGRPRITQLGELVVNQGRLALAA